MNRKIILLLVILLIASTAFVSAKSDDTNIGDSNYKILHVEKQWANDNDGLRPDSITITVLRNGVDNGTFKLTKANNWHDSIDLNLSVNDESGNIIEYTFRESGADDYSLTVVKNNDLNYTLINTYVNSTSTSGQTDSSTINKKTSTNDNTDNNDENDDSKDNSVDSNSNKNPKHTTTTKKVKTNITNKTLENKKAGNPIWILPICFIIIIALVINRKNNWGLLMNYLVVGAGNASRPVARLLNYLGHSVTVTDLKKIDEFKIEFQRSLIEMEGEGVVLDLGNTNPSIDGFDSVYVPPSLPKTAPIAKMIQDTDLNILTNEEFSKIVNELIPVDIIGITGTMGKTTTTFITSALFKEAGFNVWSCSSLTNNLVSEAIIEGIVKNRANNCDIAIFELPHGTIGLLNSLDIKIGLITNIAEDHLSEFGGSLEKYQQRKLILESMSETFITNYSCYDLINPIRNDTLYYALDKNVDFKGTIGDESLTIQHKDDSFTSPFHMMSYFFENSLAASAIALTYKIEKNNIITALTNFKGLPAHMEDVGNYNGRKVILDSAFLYDGMKITLDYFKDEPLVLFLDHFDTLSVRDKKEVGELISNYNIKVVIASGFNEVTQQIEINAAKEILNAITNKKIKKIAAKTITEAAELSLKHSKAGDIILHMGPLIAYDRLTTVEKIMKGLEEGSKKYG